MPRPAPWRLDPATYPHTQAIQTRFQDLDTQGHINNVAFAALFETGRTRFNTEAGLWRRPEAPDAERRRGVVAMQEIHYLAEGSYPEDVTVASGIGPVGNRSWSILAAMFQGGRAIATCDAVLVLHPGPNGEGLPDAMREALGTWKVREP